MPALADLQQEMARSLLAGDEAGRDAPARWFCDAAAARAGLHVHRNTVIGGCWNALRLSFPALERWLGEPSFESLAADYARAHPPEVAVLTAYGESFAEFVAARISDADRGLARDIARFDWAFDRTAQRAPGFAPAPAHSLRSGVRLTLATSLCLHAADFAVDALREQLLDGAALPGAVRADPGHWALWRTQGGVAVRRLHPSSAAMLSALLAGATIDAALQRADEAGATSERLATEVLQAGFVRLSPTDPDRH